MLYLYNKGVCVMKKLKSLIGIFVFVSILMLLPTPVLANEEADNVVVVKSYQPTSEEEAVYIFERVMSESDYWFDLMNVDTVCNATYTRCTVYEGYGPEGPGPEETWDFVYEYDQDIKRVIDSIVSQLPEGKTKFSLTEYDYINYLIYSSSDVSMATFSSELKKHINYKNFVLDVRMGDGFPLYTAMGGTANFVYDGTIYNVIPENYFAYHDHLFYLDNNVTDERQAINNKIKAVFPNIEITVTEEGDVYQFLYDVFYSEYNLESPEHSGYEDADDFATQRIDEHANDETSDYHYLTTYLDNNVYKVIIGDEGSEDAMTVYFVAVKDSSKVTDPKLITSDLKTDVTISSDAFIPLDTMIKVAKVTSGEEYEKIIGILKMTNVESFDLKLFSKSIDNYITRLDDGTFEVRIPISDNFRNKKLVVYYVDDDDKVTEYKVTVDGDYAVFNTDHFSTYTLAEAEEIANPATGDNITMNIIIGAISLIGIVGSGLYLRRKRIN